MKFNEKLIDLRKKQGLSQEELGYKLNVTRQTVSKWELGQTTPEMDKLIEISKLFNVSIDELLNNEEIETDANPIIETQTKEKKNIREQIIKIILILSLIVVMVLIVFKATEIISNKWNEIQEREAQEQEQKDKIFDTVFDTFDTISGKIENDSELESPDSQINTSRFNGCIEMYKGTQKGFHIKLLIDNINTSNKKEERKIIVKYLDTETQDEGELKNIKQNFETFTDYEVTFEYDADGYINKTIIENL